MLAEVKIRKIRNESKKTHTVFPTRCTRFKTKQKTLRDEVTKGFMPKERTLNFAISPILEHAISRNFVSNFLFVTIVAHITSTMSFMLGYLGKSKQNIRCLITEAKV